MHNTPRKRDKNDGAGFVNYYTVENSSYFQVNVATTAHVTRKKLLTDFFESFTMSW
jgi:hypothetical protein